MWWWSTRWRIFDHQGGWKITPQLCRCSNLDSELRDAHLLTCMFNTLCIKATGEGDPTSFNLPADVSRLPEVSGTSDNDEQWVFVDAQVKVCGRNAPRLLPDLPLRHPAGRHVENLQLDVMSLNWEKMPDITFYSGDDNWCTGMQPRVSERDRRC